jgi:hypothetical protein
MVSTRSLIKNTTALDCAERNTNIIINISCVAKFHGFMHDLAFGHLFHYKPATPFITQSAHPDNQNLSLTPFSELGSKVVIALAPPPARR